MLKRRKAVVSRNIKDNHVTVVIRETKDDVGNFLLQELRKTIRRANRFSGEKISYEVLITREDGSNLQEA